MHSPHDQKGNEEDAKPSEQSLVCGQIQRACAGNGTSLPAASDTHLPELCHLSSNRSVLSNTPTETLPGCPTSRLEHRAKPHGDDVPDQPQSPLNSSWKVKQQQTKAMKPVRGRKK